MKILLTEGSSMSARQTLYALGPGHTIDIIDPSGLGCSRFSRYVRRWYRCPSYSRDPLGFLEVLARRLREERYDVLLPVHEETYLIARCRRWLSQFAGLALPSLDTLDRMHSKAHFARLLRQLDIPHPETFFVHSRQELEQDWHLPCYLKLPYSTAGSGVRRVDTRQQLLEVADQFEQAGWLDGQGDVLVQMPAPGVQGSVMAVFQEGRLVGAHCFEAVALGVGGSAMVRVGVDRPQIIEHMRRIGEHLQWHGPTSMDYAYETETDQPRYIESNPRTGESFNALLSGVNLCEQLVVISLGRHVAAAAPTQGGIRTHQGFLVLLARALEGRSRRDLVRELWRIARHEGIYHDSQDEISRPREDWLSAVPALAVALLVLARPSAGRLLVNKTVKDYALPADAAQRIRNLPDEELEAVFR